MKPKLTDEELSRVLGEADIGRLNHATFRPRLHFGVCGCVAGVAMNLTDGITIGRRDSNRAYGISAAVRPLDLDDRYPAHDAESMLRYLEERGVA